MEDQGHTAASRYEALLTYRNAYQEAAHASAKLTIPALVPTQSDSRQGGDRTRHGLSLPAQSLGARGVNNLSSKMLLALFPPNSPLFRYVVDPGVKAEADEQSLQLIEQMLAERESIITSDIESRKYRPKLIEAFKQLIVAGNALLLLDDGMIRVFRMDRYVVKRDPMGRVSEIVVRESFDKASLPPVVAEICQDTDKANHTSYSDDDEISVYTHVRLDGKMYREYQEVHGTKIPGSEGAFPVDSPRWLPLTFTRTDGEDYGRGYVEEYLSDLTTFDALQRAIREDAAIAAQTIFLVDPNGPPGLEKQLTNTPNGGFIRADAGMVQTHRVDKNADMAIASNTAEGLKSDLSFAFLLNSAVQRNGDRVTAEEIRVVAMELEDTQSGLYSVLSEELLLPLVVAHERDLEKSRKLSAISGDMVRPAIVTGMDAIGRDHDLVRLNRVLADVGALAQMAPEAVQYLNVPALLSEIFAGHSVGQAGKLKTEEDVAAMNQAAQQQAMMQQAQESAMGAMEGMAPEMMKQAMSGGGEEA